MQEAGGCICGGKPFDHATQISRNKKAIGKLQRTMPQSEIKHQVLGLMKDNLAMMKCTGMETEHYELRISEYANKPKIRGKRHFGPRKIHPGQATPKPEFFKAKEGYVNLRNKEIRRMRTKRRRKAREKRKLNESLAKWAQGMEKNEDE